jgi:hypothetical protein
MILRVYALYGGNRLILGFLLVVFLAQIAIQAVVIAEGIRAFRIPVSLRRT